MTARTFGRAILAAMLLLVLVSPAALGAAGFSRLATRHFVFHYRPEGATADMEARAQECEEYTERLLSLLQAKLGRKITVRWYPTLEEYKRADATKYSGFVDHYHWEIRSGGDSSMIVYGITFLIADRVGKPSRFVLDGLAMAFFQEYDGQAWHWDEPLLWYAKNHMNDWIELSRLAMNMDYFEDSEYARVEAGVFVRYLVDVHGLLKFRKFMKGLSPEGSLTQKTQLVYGKSLKELEQDLKAWVNSAEIKWVEPAMVRVLDTETFQFSIQQVVFDPGSVSPARLTKDAEDMGGLISAVEKDLGLTGPSLLRWHIVAPRTLEFLSRGNADLEVDEAGNVWATDSYSAQSAVLAVTKASGPAAAVLRWGVALHWGEPRDGSKGWLHLSLKDWGDKLAKEELLIPLQRLFAEFPGGAPDRARAEAGLLVGYLVDTYGVENFASFYKAATSADKVPEALEALTGKSVSEVEQEFFASLRLTE